MFGINIMWIALCAWGLSSLVLFLRWLRYEHFGKQFPAFGKFQFAVYASLFIISILFFYGVEHSYLHYVFAGGGVIALFSLLWVDERNDDGKNEETEIS